MQAQNNPNRLTDLDSMLAYVIGGGMALCMAAFLLAAASGASANMNTLNMLMIIGIILMVAGVAVWLVGSRPWTKRDDWSKPRYTGHEDHGHDDHAEAHAEPHEAHTEAHVESHVETHVVERHEPVSAVVVAAPSAMVEVKAETPKVETPASAPVVEVKAETPKVETPASAPVVEVKAETPKVETPASAPVVEVKAEAPKAAPAEDDLVILDGIGPKSAAALKAAGVKTFAKIAAMSAEELEHIVKAAGVRLVAPTTTWPQQAKLAAEGKMDELQAFIDQNKSSHSSD